jgi:thioredoxin 1
MPVNIIIGYNIDMVEISEQDFDNATAAGSVVVDFFGAGCINCKMTEPVLDALANEKTNVRFVKIDTDSAPELTKKFNVSSLPTLLFMQDGKVKETLVGLKPRGVILRTIEENLT